MSKNDIGNCLKVDDRLNQPPENIEDAAFASRVKWPFEMAQYLTRKAEQQTANIGFEEEGYDVPQKKENQATAWRDIAQRALEMAKHCEQISQSSLTGPKRSTPGKEEQVDIYMLGPPEFADDCIQTECETVMLNSIGPDFAETIWPIVIKVKRDVPIAHRCEMVRVLLNGLIDQQPEIPDALLPF